MFEVEVSVPLKFSHRLEGFGEQFAVAHEHTWRVTVTLAKPSLGKFGVAVDFVRLKEELARLLKPYQGTLLNDQDAFSDTPPTAENIAIWVAGWFLGLYPELVDSVTVGTQEELARYIVRR